MLNTPLAGNGKPADAGEATKERKYQLASVSQYFSSKTDCRSQGNIHRNLLFKWLLLLPTVTTALALETRDRFTDTVVRFILRCVLRPLQKTNIKMS